MGNLTWNPDFFIQQGDRWPSFVNFTYFENKENLLQKLEKTCLLLFGCGLELKQRIEKSTEISNSFSYLILPLTQILPEIFEFQSPLEKCGFTTHGNNYLKSEFISEFAL